MNQVALYRQSDYDRAIGVRVVPAAGSGLPDHRSEFRRDYARIVHCPSFRRLNRKRQLLPNDESDFFRNRLTHSIEVAQIAKSIAQKINAGHAEELGNRDVVRPDGTLEQVPNHIDTDLVECAGLAHDIGHPPFGHTGEHELDRLMHGHGGFEGNAQTLRILARLEKKYHFVSADEEWHVDNDARVGLALTYRTLAAVLKYDTVIEPPGQEPPARGRVTKGYYSSEMQLVSQIKHAVAPGFSGERFQTVECAIMDLADDIAYSTYDIEDAYKANLLSPLAMVSVQHKLSGAALQKFQRAIFEGVCDVYGDKSFLEVCEGIAAVLDEIWKFRLDAAPRPSGTGVALKDTLAMMALESQAVCDIGDVRVALTSRLVNEAINAVEFKFNRTHPALSTVRLPYEVLLRVETLKMVAWMCLIESRKLKIIEHRERMIIRHIFETLRREGGGELLPDDHRHSYELAADDQTKCRVICDYISGMTDRYAEGFFHRLRRRDDSIFLPF